MLVASLLQLVLVLHINGTVHCKVTGNKRYSREITSGQKISYQLSVQNNSQTSDNFRLCAILSMQKISIIIHAEQIFF